MAKSFATAWLSGEREATDLLPDRFRSLAARAEAVRIAAQKSMHPELLAVVRRQNARLPASAQRDANLDALARLGTIVVVTGQQVGLFLGPLYTLYKAATAIAAARQLTAETGVACVPVFWLQTEDHDFAEIDHCFVPRTGAEPVKIALAPTEPSRVPVAHRLLGESVLPALLELETALAGLPHTADLLPLLHAFYTPGATVAHAFAQTLAAIFAEQGLVFFDPRDAEVAPFAAPFHQRCLAEAPAIAELLQVQAQKLRAAGFEPQVHIRPGSPLSFVAPDALAGPRYRLDPQADADTWTLVGAPVPATATTAQVRAWLAEEPLRLTTSALSRPVLQDLLLPSVGYVGGPGEMAYFAQLQPLYRHFDLPMPLVIHRDRFALLDERTRHFLDDRGLTVAMLARPRDDLLRQLVALGQGEAPTARLDAMMAALDLPELARQMAALDPNLAKAALRTQEMVQDALAKLLDKYAKALAQRDQASVDKLDRARLWLMPDGAPQERVYGIPGLAARFGLQPLVAAVLAACQPFAGSQQDLTL